MLPVVQRVVLREVLVVDRLVVAPLEEVLAEPLVVPSQGAVPRLLVEVVRLPLEVAARLPVVPLQDQEVDRVVLPPDPSASDLVERLAEPATASGPERRDPSGTV